VMSDEIPGIDKIPEEVLKEIEEADKRQKRTRPRRGRRPARSDIMRAVAEVASGPLIRPEEFPDLVRERLEQQGFNTSHLSDKRVWATYEEMVRRGKLRDYLRVLYHESNYSDSE